MLSFLGASENVVFVTAIVLMLLIGAIQLVGLADWAGDVDADLHADADFHLLSWLGVGRLPLLMILVLFLAIFGVAGLILQQAISDVTGAPLATAFAVPIVAVAALPLTGLAARVLAPILPRDHTTAVPLEALVGRRAQVITGRATLGSPARARTEDHHGQVHYVMVEPDGGEQVFQEGEQVLLVRREGELFRAVSRGDFYVPRLEG